MTSLKKSLSNPRTQKSHNPRNQKSQSPRTQRTALLRFLNKPSKLLLFTNKRIALALSCRSLLERERPRLTSSNMAVRCSPWWYHDLPQSFSIRIMTRQAQFMRSSTLIHPLDASNSAIWNSSLSPHKSSSLTCDHNIIHLPKITSIIIHKFCINSLFLLSIKTFKISKYFLGIKSLLVILL